MNTSTQAQKGFKTFLLTLIISLAVFSAIYYVVNSSSSSGSDYSSSETDYTSSTYVKTDSAQAGTLGASDSAADNVKKPTPKSQETSVFKELASADMHVAQRQVLAGSDDTLDVYEEDDAAESTVPDTGLVSPTYGLLFSLVALSLAAYVFYIGPRRSALSAFEKDILDELDKY